MDQDMLFNDLNSLDIPDFPDLLPSFPNMSGANMGARTEDFRLEPNINLNLDVNQADSSFQPSQNPSDDGRMRYTRGNIVWRNRSSPLDLNGSSSRFQPLQNPSDDGLIPYTRENLVWRNGSSPLDLNGSSSSDTGFLMQDQEGRPVNSMESQSRRSKRKSPEVVPADNNLVNSVSAENGANTTLSISSSSNSSSSSHIYTIVSDAECLHRDSRTRTNPPRIEAMPIPPTLAQSPVSQPTAYPAPHLPPTFRPLAWNGGGLRNSVRTPATAGQGTGTASTGQPIIAMRPAEQTHTVSFENPGSSVLANRSIGVGPTAPISRPVIPVVHYPMVSLPINRSQPSGIPNALQQVVLPSPVAIRVDQQPYARVASLLDRTGNGVVGASAQILAAARAGRDRTAAQRLREAVQYLQDENVRIESLEQELHEMLLEHPAIHARFARRHDRHRELRLDVDNMSYEELLALGERIGDVNTGLSEEIILKHMKQWKHVVLSEQNPAEIEPCCVCQEVYVEGEEVGGLDCGHDFHTACIKQWLALKNLCPICKTTGLNTEKHKMGHTESGK